VVFIGACWWWGDVGGGARGGSGGRGHWCGWGWGGYNQGGGWGWGCMWGGGGGRWRTAAGGSWGQAGNIGWHTPPDLATQVPAAKCMCVQVVKLGNRFLVVADPHYLDTHALRSWHVMPPVDACC
jgi:hypothetical protein